MAPSVATTPLPIQGPTAKEKKYDRQLRLWAVAGQQALEEANILLVNSDGPSVAGIETLKNLILPGVGSFTILDNAVVEERDLGVNFFLSGDSIGKSRAEECCLYLQELNPEVRGIPRQEDIKSLLQDDPDFLDQYSLIILVGPQRNEAVIDPIAKHADIKSIPLFYIQTSGFYSRFSVQLPREFPIVDTHPDPESTQDLRLLNSWPELLDFMKVKTAKLDEIADHEHGHIPYVLLLLHFIERWREKHEGKPPSNYKEKGEFRKMVQAAARTNNPEGGEENFDEAANAVLKSLSPPEISSRLREIFSLAKKRQINATTPNFWIIARVVEEFYAREGVLPLSGSLPDMKAQSADYVQLQNIYKAKARHDFEVIDERVREIEKALLVAGRPAISRPEVEAFCKNAASVKLVNGSPLRTSHLKLNDRANFFTRELQDDDSLASIYLCFLILDDLVWRNDGLSQNQSAVEDLLASLNQGLLTMPEIRVRLLNTLNEMTRGGGPYNELHNVAALTGGMVAQEVIKAITKQYVPIENTCVFDGIQSRVQVFRG